MYVNVVFVIRCLYSALSLTLVRETALYNIIMLLRDTSTRCIRTRVYAAPGQKGKMYHKSARCTRTRAPDVQDKSARCTRTRTEDSLTGTRFRFISL